MALRAIELFAGAGGLALGLSGVGARTVCYVEREAYAAAILVARMEDGGLAPAPVWSDVRTFDGAPWRGVVDLIAGGFPCNNVSSNGDKTGLDGEHSGLWREFVRIVRQVGPRLVFVENVADLTHRGLGDVLGDLAALGFDAEWLCLPAWLAGAPQRRDRIFVLAYAHDGGVQDRPQRDGRQEVEEQRHYRHGLAVAQRRARDAPSRIRRMDDGVAHGVDRLRLAGHGVVPDQAALAWHILGGRMTTNPSPRPAPMRAVTIFEKEQAGLGLVSG